MNFRIILRRALSPGAPSSISDSFARDAPANSERWYDARRDWHHHLACARRRRNLTLEDDTRGIGHGAGERTRAARYVPTSRHALSARARVRARDAKSQ